MDFLMEYYIWFIIIAIILVLSLIGYFIENDKKKNPKRYEKKEEVKSKKEDNNLADLKPGMTLGDAMGNSKNDNDVSSNVEEANPSTNSDEILIIDEPK